MAKPIATRGISQATAKFPVTMEGIVVDEQLYWAPCKGINSTARLSRVGREHATQIINLLQRDESMVSRDGTTPIGVPSTNIVGLVNFITVDGVATLLRFRTTAFERWSGSTWEDITVPGGLSGTITDYFTWTAFGNTLIFSNGVNGTYQYDPGAGICTLIAEAPAAKHLTTFGGRVIASGVTVDGSLLPGRIQWSVKNNSLDWDGIGSGFEDLLSTPGGNVDAQRGVHPITDYMAVVLRSNSVWLMTQTGDVEVPFRFSRISPDMGTESPYSFVGIPSACVGLMKDDVYIVAENNIKSIGSTIRRRLLVDKDLFAGAVGAYDADEREYVLLLNGTEYRYSFRFEGWVTAEHAIDPTWVAWGGKGVLGLTIDSALGTIDTPLPSDGTIDSEVGETVTRGMLYSDAEDVIETTEGFPEDWDGTQFVDSACVIASGLIQAGSVLEETEIIEVQIEYECEFGVAALIQYSIDEGTTWLTYSSVFFNVTTGPRPLACRRSLVGHNIQLRLFTAELSPLRILAFVPFVVRSKKVNY